MPASPLRRTTRRLSRTALAIVTGLAMVVSLHGLAADAVSTKTDDDPLAQPVKEPSVPGTNAKPLPVPADAGAASDVRTAPVVRWPSTGVAQADVVRPATGLDSRLSPTATSSSRESVTVGADPGRAGTLPVWVAPAAPTQSAPAASAETPRKVRVESLGRKGDALWLKVGRSDGVASPGRVELQVSYESFRNAYGGDWANRLRVVRQSDGEVFPTSNDGKGVLSADVPVPADGAAPTLFAIQAAADSGVGSFKATSLSPTATWSVGGSSGDFNWSYPMEVPPGIGGPAAQIGLDYSSGSVDGRTSTTNNQPSWAGEGFELNPGGSIERRYASCATDKGGNNGDKVTGDLCWKTDNAHFTLNGKGGELIPLDDTGKLWRMRNDDGSLVEHIIRDDPAVNGDDNGEYWKITTKDGTQYFFGLNRLPGWDANKPVTNSAWTVPVFGNHAGEPCNKPAFADSWCNQAYRMNLDYVVDANGNTMSLYYDTELNYYGRNSVATTVSKYTRAGNIAKIEYGQRDGQVYTTPPVARVLFTTAERCIPGSACTPTTYPDTPLDQVCSGPDGTPPANCDNKFNPVFFTSKRLAKVTSQVWRGTAFGDVDTWTLRHSFRDPGDGTRPGLWLEAVSNSGHVGGGLQAPEVNFDGIPMANRVDSVGDQLPPMKWFRVNRVSYGTGGDIAVTYMDPDCGPGDVPAPDTNGRRCHPMKWTPPDTTVERTDWFHKYVVESVEETDRVAQEDPAKAEPVVTTVEYLSPPMWHFDDADGLVEINQKTWGQWRGYDHVRVKKGNAEVAQSVTESRYFRGMDGDRTATGGTKDVKIEDSNGKEVDDHPALPGQIREQSTFNGVNLVERTITDQWVSKATATRVKEWGTTEAFQVEQQGNQQVETVEGGALRKSAANNLYTTDGTLRAANDENDLSNPDDNTCIYYEYTKNEALGIAEVPKRQQTVSVACDKPFTSAQVLADGRTYYDGATSLDAAPTKGNVTKTERLSGFNPDGSAKYETVATATYDAIGRGTTTTDALGNTTTTSFVPAGAEPVLQTVVTQPNGHRTLTELEPAWGEELSIVDPAGRRTEATYDALGRTSKVWLPGRTGAATRPVAPGANVAGLAAATDNAAVPNMAYSYDVSGTAPNVVTTEALQTNGSIETSYELSDGLMRTRQTQDPAPGGGRTVTDVTYDSRGLAVKENGPYYNEAAAGPNVLVPDDAVMPTQKLITYDGADRPVAEIFRSKGEEKWRTTHIHGGDRQTVDPPAGDEPTTRISNVQGQVTELRQFSGDSPTGAYDETSYSYDKAGQLTAVTDPVGNRWTYEYDIRGRKIKETDPDKGTSTYTYNELDQLVTSTDASGATLALEYDKIGRKIALRSGSLTGPKQAEWTYDTLAAGSPTSTTRYVGSNAYTVRTTGYAPNGKPLGTEVSVPASEGALAGTYQFTNTFNEDGEIATASLPAVGGLPAETLQYGYDDRDQPATMGSAETTYVRGTTYTPYGEVDTLTLGSTAGKWVGLAYSYEIGTRRLAKVVTTRETLPRLISTVSYNYDAGGNITKIADAPAATSGEPTDTQCFNYDGLRRMTAAWTPGAGDCATAPTAAGLGGPAPYWHQWTFDQTGNRKTETRTSSLGSTTATYSYPAAGQPKPHTVSQVVTTGTGMPAGGKTDSYAYDAEGNQVQRTLAGVGETFTWNAEGQLEKVVGAAGETKYVYDAEGVRLLRTDPTGTTLYLGDTEVLLKPTGQLEGTRYYRHGEQTVAVRTAGKLTWVGADHHGTSTTAIADDAGQSVQRRRMDPYGNNRGPAPAAWPGQRAFVGGTADASTGLVHLGAREYDPTLGRFISVDPEMNFGDPQTLNGFSYANNNPVTFTDPDGNSWFSSIVSAVKSVVQTVVTRVVETVKTAVQIVTPVIRNIVDNITKAVEAVKTFVKKTVEVVKKVVKTVKKVVKKVVKEVKKVVKKVAKVAKKAVAKVKSAAKKVAKAASAAVTQAARAATKAATEAGAWVWRNREQILSTALDIGLTIAACAGTAGAGCVARGLLFVATTTIAANMPAGGGAAAAMILPDGFGPMDLSKTGSHAGQPGGDPMDLQNSGMRDKKLYGDRDQGVTPKNFDDYVGKHRKNPAPKHRLNPSAPRTKLGAVLLAGARLFGALGG